MRTPRNGGITDLATFIITYYIIGNIITYMLGRFDNPKAQWYFNRRGPIRPVIDGLLGTEINQL